MTCQILMRYTVSKDTPFCIITPTTLNICITKHRTVSTSVLSSERDVRETSLHQICLPKLLVVHNANVLIWATYVFSNRSYQKTSKLYHCFCKLNACYRTLLQHICSILPGVLWWMASSVTLENLPPALSSEAGSDHFKTCCSNVGVTTA